MEVGVSNSEQLTTKMWKAVANQQYRVTYSQVKTPQPCKQWYRSDEVLWWTKVMNEPLLTKQFLLEHTCKEQCTNKNVEIVHLV